MIPRLATLVALLLAGPAYAADSTADANLCRQAISASEKAATLPPKLLGAIGLVESGRPDPQTGAVTSWPWTINVAGAGHFFTSEGEAIAAVQTAQAAGIQSIDVGCMQINLQQHPNAFANLQEAFDPATNVRYAASFLQQLYRQSSSWPMAAVAYHSGTPDRAASYAARIAVLWPLAVPYSLTLNQAIAPAASVAPPSVDPQHVLTPEFRNVLAKAAAFRQARDAAMGIAPTMATRSRVTLPAPPLGRVSGARVPHRARQSLRASLD